MRRTAKTKTWVNLKHITHSEIRRSQKETLV
jgi:hypothetical protein